MNLNHFLSFQFNKNEYSEVKLTDEEILEVVKEEFKHYDISNLFTRPFLNKQRSNYNTGWLYYKKIPTTPSFSYDSDGNIVTAQGNLMSQKTIKDRLLRHTRRLNIAD